MTEEELEFDMSYVDIDVLKEELTEVKDSFDGEESKLLREVVDILLEEIAKRGKNPESFRDDVKFMSYLNFYELLSEGEFEEFEDDEFEDDEESEDSEFEDEDDSK